MNILLTGNLIFVLLDTNTTFGSNTSKKYMAGSVSGVLFPGQIYTHQEITDKYPVIEGCNNFSDVKALYES